MELTDYLAVLRRHWRVWLGVTVLAIVIAAVALITTPKLYAARAGVFVSVSPSIPNSGQFVLQRVKSYPDVAVSRAVLDPVIDELGIDESFTELAGRLSADNPPDTSQVEIVATGHDPEETAAIANAVATELTSVVEDLETPASRDHPVRLTVTDPATVPSSPVAPVPLHVLGLGLVVGLFLGLAAAVVRARLDKALYTEADVRRVWGEDDGLIVIAPHRGRAGRSALTGNPARVLARRLELTSEGRPICVVLLSPAPDQVRACRALADTVVTELDGHGVPTAVTGPIDGAEPQAGDDRIQVRLDIGDPMSPLRVWQKGTARYDGVVLVVPAGQVVEAELREVHELLRAAELEPLAAVVTPHRGSRLRADRMLPGTGPARPAAPVERPVTSAGPTSGRLPAATAERSS